MVIRNMTTLGHDIAAFAAGYGPGDSPASAREAAVMLTVDSLGSACLTATRPFGAKVRAALPAMSPRGDQCVIGENLGYAAAGAAWANAALMHAEDFDDTPHTSHFLAALLAVGAQHHASGRDLISAWVISYEVWMLLVDRLRPVRPLNPTSVVSPAAAAVSAARLAGLDAAGIQRAMAIATASSAGLRAHFGTEAKALDAGRSAMAAVQAVHLTTLGWSAEDEILDTRNGWLATFGGPADPDRADTPALLAPSDRFPRTGRPPHAKPWPCCARHCGALTALFAVLGQDPQVRAEVRAIDVELPFEPADTAAFRTRPRTGLEAKFSVPYVLSAACLDGSVTAETFDPENFRRVTDSPMYAAVTMRYVPERAGPDGAETTAVTVRLADGTERNSTVRGAAYLDLGGVQAKFLRNSTPLLGTDRARQALDALLALEDATDVADVMSPFAKVVKEP
jgi:2-methylcitrate dehydratase PrpD